jgi:hypothetical protein
VWETLGDHAPQPKGRIILQAIHITTTHRPLRPTD